MASRREPPDSEDSAPGLRQSRIVEPALLLLLAELGTAHGYELKDAIDRLGLTDTEVPTPTIYRSLRRLEEAGQLRSTWERVKKGKPRRSYQLTTEGRDSLTQWAAIFVTQRDALEHFVVRYREAVRPDRGLTDSAGLSQGNGAHHAPAGTRPGRGAATKGRAHMPANFVEDVMATVIARNPGEPEFQQAVHEVAETLVPFTLERPEYRKAQILERMTEPDRVVIFRVSWEDECKRRKLEDIRMLLEGAINALDKVGLMLNVHRDNLDAVLAVLPALRNPTVSALSDSNWLAVNTILDEPTVRHIIPRLKKAGAQGIVEYPLNKIVM